MTDIYLQKNYGVLVPANEDAEEIIKGMKQGEVIKCPYSFPRNYENHKRFFKFLTITFDMQDHFPNLKNYRKWLVMKSGHFTIITAPNGFQIFDCDSLRFDKMEEPDFRKVFSDCIDVFLGEWGDRISREELERVVGFS